MSDLFKKQRTLETFLNRRLDDFIPCCPKCHRPAPDSFCVVHGDVDPTYESKRRQAEKLLDVIKEIEKWHNEPARQDEIIKRAEDRNIPADSIKGLIEWLKNNGYIFEPKKECYKIV